MDEQAGYAIVRCGNCGFTLDEAAGIKSAERLPCPECGAKSRKIDVFVNEKLVFRESLKLKGYHTGGKNPFVEHVQKDDLTRKTGRWSLLTRKIDRDSDGYSEIVVDRETGNVIHLCEEPLSEHRGHGSAKCKSNKKSAD